MKKRIILLLLALFTAISCISCSGDSSTDPTSSDNQLPTCAISEPMANMVYTPGSQVIIKASAADTDGNIAKIDFYIDGVVVSNDLVMPYEYLWNTAGVTNGTHTLKAVAVDNNGGLKASEVNVIIGYAPFVAITSPANGSYHKSGIAINITANATDVGKKRGKSISNVDFYIDGVLKVSSQIAPYTYNWNTTGAAIGVHKIKVITKDNTGLVSGDSINININNN